MEIRFYGDDSFFTQSMATGVISKDDSTMIAIDPGAFPGRFLDNKKYRDYHDGIREMSNRFKKIFYSDVSAHSNHDRGQASLAYVTHAHSDHSSWLDGGPASKKLSGVINGYNMEPPKRFNETFDLERKLTKHGAINGEFLGKVGMVGVSDGSKQMIHTGDVGGPERKGDVDWILDRNPDVVYLDGPFERFVQGLSKEYRELGRDPPLSTIEALSKISDIKYGRVVKLYKKCLDNVLYLLERGDMDYLVMGHHFNRGRESNGFGHIEHMRDHALDVMIDELGLTTRVVKPKTQIVRPVDLMEYQSDSFTHIHNGKEYEVKDIIRIKTTAERFKVAERMANRKSPLLDDVPKIVL